MSERLLDGLRRPVERRERGGAKGKTPGGGRSQRQRGPSNILLTPPPESRLPTSPQMKQENWMRCFFWGGFSACVLFLLRSEALTPPLLHAAQSNTFRSCQLAQSRRTKTPQSLQMSFIFLLRLDFSADVRLYHHISEIQNE